MKALIRIILLIVAISAILSAYTSGNLVFGSDDERTTARLQERMQARALRRAQKNAEKRATKRAEQKAEAKASRLQDRVSMRQELMSERLMIRAEIEARKAGLLAKQLLLSERRSTRRRELIKSMRRGYEMSIVEQNDKEVLVRSGEIVALNISAAGLDAVKQFGLTNIRSNKLQSLNITVDVFAVKSEDQFSTIVDQLKQVDPEGSYEFNQVYKMSGNVPLGIGMMSFENRTQKDGTDKRFSVGVIDTGVNTKLGSLRSTHIIQKNFGRGDDVTPRNHGTAVSSIIARQGNVDIHVADVFSGPAGYGDSESLVRALDWLAQSGVGVINMSLAGPDNAILRFAVGALTKKGHIIVASVGNEGPNGAARYPASYDNVIGVTAVDKNLKVYDKANQGSVVDIAAPGVNVLASATKGEQLFTGTSFAAPFVSAFLAPKLVKADRREAKVAWQDLLEDVTDLGAKGIDPVFGVGYLKIKNNNLIWNK